MARPSNGWKRSATTSTRPDGPPSGNLETTSLFCSAGKHDAAFADAAGVSGPFTNKEAPGEALLSLRGPAMRLAGPRAEVCHGFPSQPAAGHEIRA